MTQENNNGKEFKRGAFQAEVLSRLQSIDNKLDDVSQWKNNVDKWRLTMQEDFGGFKGKFRILTVLIPVMAGIIGVLGGILIKTL